MLLLIVGAAILYRIILLPAKPSLSEDVYRYQWEGRVEALSLNPYAVYPAMPRLQKLQDSARPLRTGTHLGGHNDSLAIFALMLANLFIIAGKRLLSNALLLLSTVSKFFALLVGICPGNRLAGV